MGNTVLADGTVRFCYRDADTVFDGAWSGIVRPFNSIRIGDLRPQMKFKCDKNLVRKQARRYFWSVPRSQRI